MPKREDSQRVPIECADCGSVYAAREFPDGRLQPIGTGNCQCGSTEFEVITDPPDADATGRSADS